MLTDMKALRLALVVIVVLAACRTSPESDVDQPAETTTTSSSTTTLPPPTTPSSTTTTIAAPTTTTTTSTTTTVPLDPLQGLALEELATGLSRPTFVAAIPGSDRLVVLEAVGRVRVIDPQEGLLADPFLNIRNKVGSISIEQGLLGLAFHPDYETNGRFFVYYTDRAGDSVLAEYPVTDNPLKADETAERVVTAIAQPDERHNAGMLQFGPDGYLYVSTGDGGAGGASVHGQDPGTLLSAILRIDIETEPYAIPPDNPFVQDEAGAPEVWAYGLRNPWRFAIDAESNTLYIGDVGQEAREEIDVVDLVPVGYNFGWPSVEGTRCFLERGCDPASYVLPVLEYSHDDGLSVTGGYVYRGSSIPELAGHYFYADWVREWIRSFRFQDGMILDEKDWTSDLRPGQINSFGLDASGELLIATWAGTVHRIVPVR